MIRFTSRGGETATVEILDAVRRSSVSVVVHRLVARGLVARRRSGRDRRRVELDLTPAGRALVRRSPPAPRVKLVRSLLGLPASDRRRLAALLRRVTRDMGVADLPATLLFEEEGRRPRRGRPGGTRPGARCRA